MLGDPLMVLDEALQFVLGLVQRDLEHVALLSLLPDLILQFRLLVKQAVSFLHKLDLVLGVLCWLGGLLLPWVVHGVGGLEERACAC